MKVKQYTNPTKAVREAVKERDGDRCIICGARPVQIAHYIPRSRLGLGVEENLVCLCGRCHQEYDNGKHGPEFRQIIEGYLSSKYDNWEAVPKVYDRWKF